MSLPDAAEVEAQVAAALDGDAGLVVGTLEKSPSEQEVEKLNRIAV
jgi:hypothetical protein